MTPHKRVQVENGTRPSEDRFVSMTTARILATDVYVVGVVDGTGRLADHTTLLATPNHERARRHANRLVQKLGKVEPTHYAELLPAGTARSGYGLRDQTPAGVTTTEVDPVRLRRNGKYGVKWQVAGQRRRNGRSFDTECEAIAFRNQLKKELGS